MESHDYTRVKNEANFLADTATRLVFAKDLLKGKLVDEKMINDYEGRQLKAIKTSLAHIYAQLELHKVETRTNGIFSMTEEEEE